MQLCYETNKQLAHRLLHFQSIKEVDKTFSVCNIPGSDAHGCASALAAIDTNASGFSKIAAVTKGVIKRSSLSRKGQFQVGATSSLYSKFVLNLHRKTHIPSVT